MANLTCSERARERERERERERGREGGREREREGGREKEREGGREREREREKINIQHDKEHLIKYKYRIVESQSPTLNLSSGIIVTSTAAVPDTVPVVLSLFLGEL